MQLVSVNYNKTYATGPFLNEKIGVEASLENGDNVIDVLNQLREIADNFHKVANPHLYNQNTTIAQPPEPGVLPVTPVEKETQIGRSMVDQIMSSGDMKILETYKLIVKNNAEWKAAYDLRFEQIKAIEVKDILDRTNAVGTRKGQKEHQKTIANAKN